MQKLKLLGGVDLGHIKIIEIKTSYVQLILEVLTAVADRY